MDALIAFSIVVATVYLAVIKPRLRRGCRVKPEGVRIEPSREAQGGPYDYGHPMAWPILDPAFLNHHGWERIGPVDTDGQRSVWMRIRHINADCDGYTHDACGYVDAARTVRWIEIRGGRNGGEFFMKLGRTDPMFEQVLGLCTLCASVSTANHLNTVVKES